MKKVNFVKNIKLFRDESESGLLAVKAIGITELNNLISPVLISSRNYISPPSDGIYELDFVLDTSDNDYKSMEMEVDIIFKIKNLPSWVKGFKINAKENSDIILI
ncbi:MAG: hypothetical protein FJY07_11145 [Bacteroidetes bacterium]|nr:hypothetical protein [Bacteroidota bacterium]